MPIGYDPGQEMTGNGATARAGVGGKPAMYSSASTYIGQYLEELYNYTNSTAFYNYSSAYLKPYYRKVQNWERWINGYVPEFHRFEQGVLPTHLAKFIVDKVSALIYGNGVILASAGDDKDTGANDTLDKIGRWAKETKFPSRIQSIIKYAVGLGTGVLKLNVDEDEQPWIESVPMNRCRYEYDAKGAPVSASFQIEVFFPNNGKRDFGFGLFERRFYHEGKPYGVYSVYRLQMQTNIQQAVDGTEHVGFKELPDWMQKTLKHSYGCIRLDEPVLLPFQDIAVYPYKFTPVVSSMPHLKYGDSVLEGLNDYLCKYDQLAAAMDTEVYCGRARAWAKKAIKNPTAEGDNFNTGLDTFMLAQYESLGNTEQPLQFFQPDIRTEQFRGMRNIILEDICTGIGISPSSFAAFLQDGAARTAREVSAEENLTTLFVANHRTELTDAIDAMLDAVCGFFGLTGRVKAVFSQAGQTNFTLLVENTQRLYQSGLMSLETAVKAVNPSMDEAQLAAEIERIKAEQAEKQAMQKENLWDFGDTEQVNG